MAEALKDRYFQAGFFNELTKQIQKEYPDFNSSLFKKNIFDNGWEELALKERMSRTSQILRGYLPTDYLETLVILKSICHHFKDFDAMIFPDFVEQFGIEHFDPSIQAIELFTQHSSGEFAIRPFILKYERETMTQMLKWSRHESEHVRRLSSEGCRPRLPWAMALPIFKKDPSLVIPILENLKSDRSLYVRKSVANNLNDITKDNPDLVIELVEKWKKKGATKETIWIIKHALRGLLKAGHPEALKLLGFDKIDVRVEGLEVNPLELKVGKKITFCFDLINNSKTTQNVMADYIIHFMKSNGKTAPKVFKLKNLNLPPGQTISLKKSHNFKLITTRKYYPGEHKLEIQINGNSCEMVDFRLRG